jgi:hypothetical protein
VLRFSEQRQQDEHAKHGGLHQDRENECAAAQPARAPALLRTAFDKTSA